MEAEPLRQQRRGFWVALVLLWKRTQRKKREICEEGRLLQWAIYICVNLISKFGVTSREESHERRGVNQLGRCHVMVSLFCFMFDAAMSWSRSTHALKIFKFGDICFPVITWWRFHIFNVQIWTIFSKYLAFFFCKIKNRRSKRTNMKWNGCRYVLFIKTKEIKRRVFYVIVI